MGLGLLPPLLPLLPLATLASCFLANALKFRKLSFLSCHLGLASGPCCICRPLEPLRCVRLCQLSLASNPCDGLSDWLFDSLRLGCGLPLVGLGWLGKPP